MATTSKTHDLSADVYHVGNRGGKFRVMRDDDGHWMGDIRDSNSQDSARIALLLAAPKLLDACQQSLREIERLYTGQPPENFEANDTVIMLRKAINKAIGGL